MRDLVIIMGVAGSGKSSIAEALSKAEGWPFVEADVHHSAANKEKMTSGAPLTDADRADWVRSMGETMTAMPEDRVVLACSALTPFVQTGLREQSGRTCLFVLLDVPKDELARRISSRADHFMPVSLLDGRKKLRILLTWMVQKSASRNGRALIILTDNRHPLPVKSGKLHRACSGWPCRCTSPLSSSMSG